jgi:hypothetical protein
MTTVRKINVSQVEGGGANSSDPDEIRPFGEIAAYVGDNNKLELLMFDGERTYLKSKVLNKGTFYGGDADSGDGAGLDTIKLIPDAELHYNNGSYGNNQHIIIDPTAPNHIHIRAGGTIDNSNADLFLGGERNNVKVSDDYDNVQITTDAGEGGIKTWLFDGGGAVTFPDSTVQTTAFTGIGETTDLVSTTTASITTASNANDGPFVGMVSAPLEGNGTVVFGPAGGTSEPDQLDGVDLTRLVGGTITQTGTGFSSPILSVTSLGNKLYSIQVEGTLATVTGGSGIGLTITVDPLTEKIWTFGTDGSLTFPLSGGAPSGKINPGVSDGGGLQIEAEYDFEIKVTQFEDDPTIWSFAGGDITFPDGSVQSTAWTGNVDWDNVTNTPTIPADVSELTDTQGLLVGGSANTGAITFDDNEIQANPLDTVGTQITVNSNYISVTSQNSNVFNLTKSADTDQVLVGWIIRGDGGGPQTITNKIDNGSYWSFFVAMGIQTEYPITIESPDYQVGSDPQLILTVAPDGVAATSWTFDDNGTLTLPAGGDIVNSTGVSQTAQRVEGSWTVATGTATYSFTVPSDGTYVMWVKGNIPNGIITWNATASVSNTNVPAIGSQYAWNYTGGGSPILLTAIPDQIKGTEGGISTDNSYVGTTSNRFDFTIANTSGASQTIYYGYTKI